MKIKNITLLISVLLFSFIFTFNLMADNDNDEDEDRESGYYIHQNKSDKLWSKTGRADFGPVQNALYQKECGACHLAFQPGLLPGRSWNKLLDGLAKHFEDDASLKKGNLDKIRTYLLANSLEYSKAGKAGKLMRSIGSGTPGRISDIPYLKREHNEVPTWRIKQKSIRTISNCQACHTTADKGNYSERNIHIPK